MVVKLDEDELIEHWTLVGDELGQVAGKRGATRLGFSLLKKKIFSSSACDGAPAYRPYVAASSSVRNSTGIAANYDRPVSNQLTATKPLQD